MPIVGNNTNPSMASAVTIIDATGQAHRVVLPYTVASLPEPLIAWTAGEIVSVKVDDGIESDESDCEREHQRAYAMWLGAGRADGTSRLLWFYHKTELKSRRRGFGDDYYLTDDCVEIDNTCIEKLPTLNSIGHTQSQNVVANPQSSGQDGCVKTTLRVLDCKQWAITTHWVERNPDAANAVFEKAPGHASNFHHAWRLMTADQKAVALHYAKKLYTPARKVNAVKLATLMRDLELVFGSQ